MWNIKGAQCFWCQRNRPHIIFFFIFFFFQLPWTVDDVQNAMPIVDIKMGFLMIKHGRNPISLTVLESIDPMVSKTPLKLIHTSKIIVARAFWTTFCWSHDASRRRGLRQKFCQKIKKSSWILKLWYFWTAALHNITLMSLATPFTIHFYFFVLVSSTFSLQGKEKKYFSKYLNSRG